MAKTRSASEAASNKVRSNFDLGNFKKSKKLSTASIKFKEQQWIPMSPAFKEITSVPGIAHGHITILRGHSDTGKTTALLEAAVNAQKMGILPVFLITEMKWNWDHAKEMGLQFDEIADEDTGEIVDYDGFFLYQDRSTLQTIEDVAAFIADMMDEQKKGNLPYDMCFFWDSVGSPRMENKGGTTMWYDSSVIITFGNVTNSGTSKIKAIKDGKTVEYAKRTNIQVDKNHINGVTTRGKIIMTSHGFILDDKRALDKYKDQTKDKWFSFFGTTDFDLVEDAPMEEDGGNTKTMFNGE